MMADTTLNTIKKCGPLAYRENKAKVANGAETFVFLHGNGFSSSVFSGQLESSQFANSRVIAFDLPGHGDSKPLSPDASYTFENMGTMLIKAFNALNLSNITLIGWSLGGHVALDMLDRSPRIARAIICGAPPMRRGALSTLWAYHFSRDMLLASKRQFTTIDAARFEKLCVGKNIDAQNIRDLTSVDPQMRASVAKSVFASANRDQHFLATNSEKPLMILQGENDPIVRTSFVSNFARSNDYRGDYQIISGAGHAPFLDAPQKFNELIFNFVQNSQSAVAHDTQGSVAA